MPSSIRQQDPKCNKKKKNNHVVFYWNKIQQDGKVVNTQKTKKKNCTKSHRINKKPYDYTYEQTNVIIVNII